MILKRITNKALVASIAVLAAFALILTACSAPSSSSSDANGAPESSSDAVESVETDTEGTTFDNTYVIEGFTGAESGSDQIPEPDAKMQTIPSIEVSFPSTWKIIETQIREYPESRYGTLSKDIILEGPTGLQASIMLAANMYGGAFGNGCTYELIGPTGIEDIVLAWCNMPESASSYILYLNQRYIDEQEKGTLEAFPSLAYLQEGTLNCSLIAPGSNGSSVSSNIKTNADNADLDTALAILESVRLAS